MAGTLLFLDTEWADVLGADLVSLALVSEDGAHVFYAERDPLPPAPTEFVRGVVYPLLDRGDAAKADADFTAALRNFLCGIPSPCVMADFANDVHLLKDAIGGFSLPDEQAQACGPVPRPVMTRVLRDGRIVRLIEDWFEADPERQRRRHHALVDAHALRAAWIAATEGAGR